MRCALAAVGFINGNTAYNKTVIADTLKKRAGKADVVIFGEAFLQGFSAVNFTPEHDAAVAVSQNIKRNTPHCSTSAYMAYFV